MGGPLSTLLSKLYMQNYETTNIIDQKIFSPRITVYLKYVGDTYCLKVQVDKLN